MRKKESKYLDTLEMYKIMSCHATTHLVIKEIGYHLASGNVYWASKLQTYLDNKLNCYEG